ncbi:MAG: RluA family pseudouridine synthase [Thermodesulfobacteriota bacterium]
MGIKGGSSIELEIPEEFSGQRADLALAGLLKEFSRSQIRRLIDDENILLKGRAIKPSQRLIAGDSVSITVPPPTPLETLPQDIPISIIYEDQDILVVNKPPGMAVHPGAGIREGTLVNAILYKCRNLSGIGGKTRPGIVHRLDKNTSGVLIVAKNDFSHRSLVEQFKSRDIEKRYLALVIGNVEGESGSFCSLIGRHPKNRLKMTTKPREGKEAFTNWRVKKRYNVATLIEVDPKTGRTHQIRVQFSENGYPILGDKLYGRRRQGSQAIDNISEKLGRQALHAYSIRFKHPRRDEIMEFKAPIPEDFEEAIKLIEEYRVS